MGVAGKIDMHIYLIDKNGQHLNFLFFFFNLETEQVVENVLIKKCINFVLIIDYYMQIKC